MYLISQYVCKSEKGDKGTIRMKDKIKRWILKYERNYSFLNRAKEKMRAMFFKDKGWEEKMWNMKTYAKENYSSLNVREAFSIPVTQYVTLMNDCNGKQIQNPWKMVGYRMLGTMFGQLQHCKTVSRSKGLSLTLEQTRRRHTFFRLNPTEEDRCLWNVGQY
jgi:hypothetical protein